MIALLLLLAQDDLAYTLPKGWTKRLDDASKTVQLSPPGGQDAQVVLYPTSPQAALGAQDFHAAMWKTISTNGRVEGTSTSGRTGDFLWTRAKLLPAAGGEIRVALYTAKFGETFVTGVYGGAEKVFDVLLPAVDELFQGMRPRGTSIFGLDFPPLAGWTRKDDPSGAVVLLPPPPRGPLEPTWDYVMIALPSQPLRGTHWETHRKIFDEAVKGAALADPVPAIQRVNAAGPFIKSETAGRDASGAIRPLALYTALSDGKVEVLVVRNQEDVETTGALLSRVRVKSPPKEVAKIAEAWRRVDASIRLDRTSTIQYQRIWLRADGVADFSTTYPEGYAASPVPAKLDRGLLNGDVGAWTASGGEIRITRRAGVVEVYAREGGTLRKGDEIWQPMPSVDGLRLEGRWGLSGARIAFTAAGRFEDEGALRQAATPIPLKHAGSKELFWPTPPAKGAGTYEIRDFTLLLRYDDGGAFATDFSTLGSDLKDLSVLLLRTTAFRKE